MSQETVVYEVKGTSKYSLDGRFVDMPDGWEFVPSGDPALTRRLKISASDFWIVKRRLGRKEFGIGLCVPGGLAADIAEQLRVERETPEYQRKLSAGRKRRAREEAEYREEFCQAIMAFLAFAERYRELALRLARAITEFATPVGSGTVARTQRISVEERARAAVIAWMRHNTTDYDHRYIPRVAGKRREVRRELAQESLALLNDYRRGSDIPAGCPLQKALAAWNQPAAAPVIAPASKADSDDFWL